MGSGSEEKTPKSASGAASRNKGAAGQRAAIKLLQDRDYVVDVLSAGFSSGDLMATGEDGTWYVEVKNTKGILPSHMSQAMEQAQKRKLRWMLLNKLAGTSSWLVRRQGEKPTVWHEKKYQPIGKQ